MTIGIRITLTLRNRQKRFVLLSPPFPEIGDQINMCGEKWTVSTLEPTEILARIPILKKTPARG